ncbi:hypothetical protein KCP69_15290 [Salmonella enterica subsp. enterica]|nr:hypothetical protein KCP69_15290 [Salmonella enterica subsp. enterica]
MYRGPGLAKSPAENSSACFPRQHHQPPDNRAAFSAANNPKSRLTCSSALWSTPERE